MFQNASYGRGRWAPGKVQDTRRDHMFQMRGHRALRQQVSQGASGLPQQQPQQEVSRE